MVGRVAAEEPGRVFVYSKRSSEARAWLPVWCDGKVAADVREGRFFALELPAGRHALSTEMGVPVVVEVRGGEDSFVRVDWSFGVGRAAIPVLAVVKAKVAVEEMRHLTYIDAKRVKGATVARADPRGVVEPKLRSREER